MANSLSYRMPTRFFKTVLTITGVGLFSFNVNFARAQCANPVTPNCSPYEQCFEKYCPCEGTSDNYFISYGKKYCDKFLSSTGWSPSGDIWRKRTLICLQESIVPLLPISNPSSCNCSSMKTHAFNSHVKCYTDKAASTSFGSSICLLPLPDLQKIFEIIEPKDLFDQYGWNQMKQVASICVDQVHSVGIEYMNVLWNEIKSKINEHID